MKTVDEISRLYGCEIEMDGESIMRFLCQAAFARNLEELEQTGAGFRCKYIMNAAKMVNEGKITLRTFAPWIPLRRGTFL